MLLGVLLLRRLQPDALRKIGIGVDQEFAVDAAQQGRGPSGVVGGSAGVMHQHDGGIQVVDHVGHVLVHLAHVAGVVLLQPHCHPGQGVDDDQLRGQLGGLLHEPGPPHHGLVSLLTITTGQAVRITHNMDVALDGVDLVVGERPRPAALDETFKPFSHKVNDLPLLDLVQTLVRPAGGYRGCHVQGHEGLPGRRRTHQHGVGLTEQEVVDQWFWRGFVPVETERANNQAVVVFVLRFVGHQGQPLTNI